MSDAAALAIIREIIEGATPDDECNCRPDRDGIVHEACTFHQIRAALDAGPPDVNPHADCAERIATLAATIDDKDRICLDVMRERDEARELVLKHEADCTLNTHRLEGRIATLEKALRPLAEVIEGIPLKFEDVNRARAALAPTGKGEGE